MQQFYLTSAMEENF